MATLPSSLLMSSLKKAASTSESMACGHCLLPLAKERIAIDSAPEQLFCCYGCASVWQFINGSGLDAYYQKREKTPSETISQLLSAKTNDDFSRYDQDNVAQLYIQKNKDGLNSADLMVDGIHCAACIWLIEQFLLKQKGVVEASLNFGNHRAHVVWNPDEAHFSEILQRFQQIGYSALPYDASIQEQKSRDAFRQMVIRLAVAAFCAGNVMMLSVSLYAGYFSGIEDEYKFLFEFISGVLTLPVIFYSAVPFWQGAWRALKIRQPNMDFLISLGIGVTFSASVVALMSNAKSTYFDSCTMITFFLLISRTLEHLTKNQVSSITERLTQLSPQFATLISANNKETLIPHENIQTNDLLLVRQGDTIPVDGIVMTGKAEIDESALTGESMWRFVNEKSSVIGGSISQNGSFVMKATAVGRETMLNRVVQMIEQATQKKTRIQRIADRVASWFVWVVLLLTFGTWAYWTFLGTPHSQPAWYIAVSVIIIACPCALSLATPTAILAGTGIASKRGILIKGGDILEQASEMSEIVFDKTGTLTSGEMEVISVQDLSISRFEDWFRLALSLEAEVNHPIAKALRLFGEKKSLTASAFKVGSVEQHPGKGISGQVDNRLILVGNREFLNTNQVFVPEKTENSVRVSKTLPNVEVFVAIDRILCGQLILKDQLRNGAEQSIQSLKKAGKHIHILSGDRQEIVDFIAKQLGIDQAHGNLMPDQKLEYLQKLQLSGKKVMMLGDGINDAPSLQQADLGVALGNAADISLEAADVVLLQSQLNGAVELLQISQKTTQVIRQNLGISLAYNALTIPLAMMGWVNPLFAASAMAFSSIFVTLNALRLKHSQFPANN
ncbi:MAG: heavy metal translocating P-type ATPase [SAR324 cluster bacterium]|nr:heavy metal translocating P-type ATPase [SAR324 cluster bacterium]